MSQFYKTLKIFQFHNKVSGLTAFFQCHDIHASITTQHYQGKHG